MTTSTDVVPSNRELRATRLLEIAEPILEAAALNKRVTIAAGDLLRQVRVFLPNPAHTSEVQADHIADERKMVAADLYLWLAGSNDNRFIRAWTDDPARVDSLREAIGLEPARHYAAPAQPCGDAEQADAPQETILLTGELVDLGADDNGSGDMTLSMGARNVSIAGLSIAEVKALKPFLFQRITLTVAPQDCSADPTDCPNNEGYGCGCGKGLNLASVKEVKCGDAEQADEAMTDAFARLVAFHAEQLDSNPYCYFELAYTRSTAWMAWITDRPAQGEPGTAAYAKSRKVIVRGQGATAEEACADALAALTAPSTGDQS